MKIRKTILVAEKFAKIFNSAIRSHSKKELYTFFHKAEITLKGELENVSPFGEAGEGGYETTEEKVFMAIDW